MEIPGYEIERCIGHGGMASAYLARQTSLDRKVVLKVLDTSVTDSKVAIERFLNEGRIVASLQHPHIITTYDIGTAGTDVYISMEFVDGGDLKHRLRDGVYSPVEALELIAKIASSLEAAHAKGIVHRDVKPGNILFRGDGTPLLSDFGIAKRLSGDADLTSTGMFVGSPNYMAPEQSDTGPIDGRADIYALGCIFFEMLTGRKPYISESVIDIILKHKKAPVPELPAGLEEYQELLDLMMAKDRNDRFRDAASLSYFITRMTTDGMVKSINEMASAPDFKSTGSPGQGEVPQPNRLDLGAVAQTSRMRALLLGIAIVCALAYGVLIFVERRMNATPRPTIASETMAMDNLLPDPLPPLFDDAQSAEQSEKVSAALSWLGTHSLNEYRLTAPPKDNAFYYFSRLGQLDPGSETARQGLAEIAARYALLAEREIADGNYATAQRFIQIGLRIVPNNETLLVLRDLAVPSERGMFAVLRRLFSSSPQ